MKRHRVRGVRRVRLSGFRIDHLLSVAVIGGDQRNPANGAHRLGDPSQASIYVLAGFDRLVELAGVADHVGIGEVDDENIRPAFINRAQQVVRYLEGGHRRLEIVCSDPWRRHQQPLLAGKFFFRAAVEKISYVRVLFGFGKPEVLQAEAREHVCQNVLMLLSPKRDGERKGHVIN